MKQKKNETVSMGLVIGLMLFCTVVAGGLALLSKNDGIKLPEISLDKLGFAKQQTAVSLAAEAAAETAEEAYMDEELHKIANTYGEIFGLLVTEGKASLTEDKYCADELYEVRYDSGKVQINTNTRGLYWFQRNNVKTNEIKLTERQLLSKAREYFNILQLDQDYSNIARKVDREKNTATVIFQKVVDEELDLYSDYEAVKMVLSAQTGELMSCKIFNLPLVEQEGQKISQTAAAAAVQDQRSIIFSGKAEGELAVCSPIIWGDEANYTSRIVWKITADDMLYYVDAYSGTVLGSRSL